MTAVLYRLRCIVRSRWRATAGSTVTVALLVGVVLMFAAGARRTLSAPDRYAAAQGSSYDAYVFQSAARGVRTRAAEIAGLTQAEAVESMTFVFGHLTTPAVLAPGQNISVFSGTPGPSGERLLAGRLVDPTKPDEFVATRSFVEATHAAIGDEFDLATLTQEQADAAGFDNPQADGPSLRGVLVGVIDGPSQLDDPSPLALFSPALLDDPTIGVAISLISVKLVPDATLESFQVQLDTLPRSQELKLQPTVAVSDNVRAAVGAQGQGLRLLALLAAIATAVVLTQLVSRQVRLPPADRGPLHTVGMTAGQMLGESTGRAAVPIVLGSLLGAALSTLLSGLFPTGFVRRIEVHPGFRADVAVLLVGTATAIVVLLASTVLTLVTTRPGADSRRPSAAVETIARSLRSVTAATGLRFAFTRRDRDSSSVRSTVVGLLLTIACLVGVIAFGSSLDRLVGEPNRFGINYDAQFDNGADTTSPELVAALDDDEDLSALSLYADGQARVGSTLIPLVGFESIRGTLAPEVLVGRLPASEDEIALGRLEAKDLGVGIGDTVTVEGDAGPRSMRVTGLAVIPNIGLNDGVGKGAVLTLAAMRRLNPSGGVTASPVVRLRPGAPADTLERLSQATGVAGGRGTLPPAIVNVARVRSVPAALAALLVALAALTVSHVMLTSIRNRRRDLAVLSALGADRRWITRVVHWQATTVVVLATAIGVPLGLVAGRFVFTLFADSIGTRNDASLPWSVLAAVTTGVVVLANITAALPGRQARRLTPARVLHSE